MENDRSDAVKIYRAVSAAVLTEAHQVNKERAKAFQEYLDSLDLDKQKKEVAAAQQKVDEKRALLVDAAKNRKILDKLKEKQSLAHMQRSMRNEQNFMNEIAGNRHLRQRQPAK